MCEEMMDVARKAKLMRSLKLDKECVTRREGISCMRGT